MQHVPLPFDLFFFIFFFNGISHLRKVGYKHPILQMLLYSLPLSRLAWQNTSSPPFLVKLNGEGRWQMKTSHLFRHTKKTKVQLSIVPPKNILRKHSAMSPFGTFCLMKPGQPWDWGPALRWWTWSNTLHELDKRTMRGRFPEWSTYVNKKVKKTPSFTQQK